MLATGGEAYLHTPEESLPLFVRLSLDVWAACLGAAAVLVYTAFLLARLAIAKLGDALARRATIANSKASCHSVASYNQKLLIGAAAISDTAVINEAALLQLRSSSTAVK